MNNGVLELIFLCVMIGEFFSICVVADDPRFPPMWPLFLWPIVVVVLIGTVADRILIFVNRKIGGKKDDSN